MIHYDFDDDDDDENDDDDDDDDDCKCGATSGLDGTCLYHRLFRLKSYERLSVVLIELQGLGFIQPEIPSKSHVWIHIYTMYTCVYHFISYIHPMKIIYHKYEDKSIFIPFIHMVLIPFYIL